MHVMGGMVMLLNKMKPDALKVGDTVGLVAPASWPNVENAKRGIEWFEQKGLRVVVGESLTRMHGYLGGTDQERVNELHAMFADPNIKAIFSVCGGYGTGRIIERLDYELIRSNPKIIWGFSDLTFLLNAIYQQTGLITFHGPMIASGFGRPDEPHPLTAASFEQLFTGETPFVYDERISSLYTITDGEASGEIVGGNLSLLASMVGTPYDIDTAGKLLLIEEIEEDIYRIDRMLNQLRMAGKFEAAAGVIFGDFNNCTSGTRKETLSLTQVFHDHVGPSGKPALGGFRMGHCSPNIAVPIGAVARLDTAAKTLVFDESGVK